ncbi:NYN domain-containing protein [Moraxella oblonga]|uniref:NYN domain-containing protein n=1 Tax=Moraxella oblonga TaxID=200413 RepID=UPI000832A3D5|nr:NYN domain-containing protein [Moraxella oblonga]
MLKNIAVLIDADNVSSQKIDWIFNKIGTLGTIAVKRIYGDFTKPNLSSWEDAILKYAIEKKHQTSYSTGKNSSDLALAIDAIDLWHTDRYDGFCIVSSDSDFIGLALRLRQSNIQVFGFGENKTIKEFTIACDKFFEIPSEQNNGSITTKATKENKSNQANTQSNTKKKADLNPNDKTQELSKPKLTSEQLKKQTILINAIKDSIAKNINKINGYSEFKKVTQYLNTKYPTIKASNYGYAEWHSLLNQLDFFEIKTVYEVLCIRIRTPYIAPIKQSKPPIKYITKPLKYKIMLMIDKAPIKDKYGYTDLNYIEEQLKIMSINIEDYHCKDIKSFLRKVGCILKD